MYGKCILWRESFSGGPLKQTRLPNYPGESLKDVWFGANNRLEKQQQGADANGAQVINAADDAKIVHLPSTVALFVGSKFSAL